MRSGRFSRVAAVAVAAAVSVGVLAGCGGSSGGDNNAAASTPTPDANADKAAIKANWETFFNAKTPQAQRLALLQNAPVFTKAIAKAAKQPGANDTTAKVVTVTADPALDPAHPTATVTYNLYVGGQKVITKGTAQAVYDNGEWKVSQSAFCGLIGQIVKIPACQ